MKLKVILPTLLFLLVFSPMQDVQAEAWWGKGAKPHKWILSHGGALIRYEITNRKGDANEYKATLTKGKKNVEIEVGKRGLFDDALPGKYTVSFYYGGDGEKSFHKEKGKKVGSIDLEVQAGETIRINFNYRSKKISFTTDHEVIRPKPKANPVPAPPVPVPVPEPAPAPVSVPDPVLVPLEAPLDISQKNQSLAYPPFDFGKLSCISSAPGLYLTDFKKVACITRIRGGRIMASSL